MALTSHHADPTVLIVGAGPTGLNIALRLARRNIPFLIIDTESGPGFASRAITLQARTLEFYRQLGLDAAIVKRGIKMEKIEVWLTPSRHVDIVLRDLGSGLSPYPFALDFPQDDHEQFLVEELKKIGVEISWNTALNSFTQDADGIRAILEKNGRSQTQEFSYLCGCDGASSRVRHVLGLDFPGGTYGNLFYVADVAIANRTTQDGMIKLEDENFALVMPVRSSGTYRLIGILPPDAEKDISFAEIKPGLEAMLDIRIDSLNWFSTYRVHHRVAAKFREGRCFLAGDSGHVHSPAGGQGMNTGIGDAVNLAWKLAEVLQGRAGIQLLDTYEPERIAFARRLVSTTDTAFHIMVDKTIFSRLLRHWIIPMLLPKLSRSRALRELAFKTVSQINISYMGQALNEGRAGRIRGGHRLPWVSLGEGDNFAALQSLDWQVHVYGNVQPDFASAVAVWGLACHVFSWTAEAERVGLSKDAAYLIRPDGHVGLAMALPSAQVLQRYLSRWGLSFRPST